MKTSLLILFIFLFLSGMADALNIQVYVDTGCGNVGTYVPSTRACTGGTATTRNTISGGIAALTSGDTLNIRAGTYNETITNAQLSGKSGSGFAANPVGTTGWGNINTPTTIQAYQNEVVTIGHTGSSKSIAFQTGGITVSYILFKNLRVLWGVQLGAPSNVQHHIKFDGMDIQNQAFLDSNVFQISNCPAPVSGQYYCDDPGGIAVLSDHIWITNSKIHDTNPLTSCPSRCEGYLVYNSGGSDTIFEFTEFYNSTGYGIHQDYGVNNNNIYRYNYFHDIAVQSPNSANGAGFVIHIGGDPAPSLRATTGNNNQFYGNLITHSRNGIDIVNKNNSVFNNTLYRIGNGRVPCNSSGIDNCYAALKNSDQALGTNFIRNNIVFDNAVNAIADDSIPFPAVITNNFLTNPFFVDASNPGCTGTDCAGFHLQAISNARDPFGVAVICPTCGPGGTQVNAPFRDAGAYPFAPVVVGTPPTIAITSPTPPTFSTSSAALTLSGNAMSNGGTGLGVAWTCDRCGSGTATLAAGTWSATGITLRPGINILTATATDSAGSSPATLTATYAPPLAPAALVGAWGFEEGSGPSAMDSSGKNNTLSLQPPGAALWTTAGKSGNAVSLDGSSQYLVATANPTLDFTSAFTFSAWVQPTVSLTNFATIITKNTVQYLYAAVQGYCGSGGEVMGFLANGTVLPASVESYACSPTGLLANIWTHIAGTYDGTTLRLYKNGVLVTGPGTVSTTGIMEPTGGTLQVGGSDYGEYFQGLIDEVRVYNRAIPISAGSNTVPGAVCVFGDPLNSAEWSVIRDMNCPVVQTIITPPVLKIPSGPAGLKIGAGASPLKVGSK